MVEDLVALVLHGELVPFLGDAVGAVEEAVALPGRSGELGPLDVVFQQFAGLHVHYVELLPVAAAARDAVGNQAAVFVERNALEGDGAVLAELVGVEEDARLAVGGVHFVKNALVLKTVVAVDVPFAVLVAAWYAYLLIVDHLGEAGQQFAAERNLVQVMGGVLVLGGYPGGRLFRVVVFQPAVRVCHFRSEVVVNSVVFPCNGHLGCAGACGNASHNGECDKCS